MLQQGNSKSPECSKAPQGAHTACHEQQGTKHDQQDSILPQPPAQTVCTPTSLTEKQLPRLLCKPKGRKPALPGQTGDDIVASLSCKFLNTTSCQGPLPMPLACTQTTWNQAENANHGHHQPSLSQPCQPGSQHGDQMPALPACWKHCTSREPSEGSSLTVLSHSCPGLGASDEERVEDTVFQPHKALAVPTLPQRWTGYL